MVTLSHLLLPVAGPLVVGDEEQQDEGGDDEERLCPDGEVSQVEEGGRRKDWT